jgi:hypothetical protein
MCGEVLPHWHALSSYITFNVANWQVFWPQYTKSGRIKIEAAGKIYGLTLCRYSKNGRKVAVVHEILDYLPK